MSRDKQIEEMADIITDAMLNGAENFVDCVVVAVEGLVAKDYRKASDVAEEIFAEIESIMADFPIYGHANTAILNENDFAELKKKYTEEIQ